MAVANPNGLENLDWRIIMAKKVVDRTLFDYLLGKDDFDQKTIDSVKARINTEKRELFSTIKWGGSSFERWDDCDDVVDGNNIMKYREIQIDLGFDRDDILQRYLDSQKWESDEIDEMINSVSGGNWPNLIKVLLEFKERNFVKENNMVDFDLSKDYKNVSIKEAKKLWKFQKDNSKGGYKITGYLGKEDHIFMPSAIDNIPVVTLSDYAFKYLQFERIELSENLTAFGHSVFYDNIQLTEVVFPNEIEELPKSVFIGCSNLKRVVLPKNVKKISPWTFTPSDITPPSFGGPHAGLENLEEIWIDPSNENYGSDHGVLIDKKKNTIVYCPAKIKEYSIPENVKKITGTVFAVSELKDVYIHEKVNSISDDAFAYCEGLTIHAPKGSYAIEYAKQNNINYVEE